jgi:hypothetical protein
MDLQMLTKRWIFGDSVFLIFVAFFPLWTFSSLPVTLGKIWSLIVQNLYLSFKPQVVVLNVDNFMQLHTILFLIIRR